jgi:activator of 2-hydroxyglutaryl-CoA dehydratase/predicted nucleotide-binding protein (sugar kinase/HSP70/actin superfamily)
MGDGSFTATGDTDPDRAGRIIRVAGCDLGKAVAKFVVGSFAADGRFVPELLDTSVHEGKPLEAFRQWYERRGVQRCAALGATGLYARELAAPALAPLPTDACLAAALPVLFGPSQAVNLISFGARGYGALSRSEQGRVRVVENEKCSSGTGETMVKIAHRFGLTIDEADRLASGTTDVIPITARCSVFAKTEMTHFANQGKPIDALFRGYFRSIAKHAAALLARIQVDGPAYALGGGSRIGSVIDALSECLGREVRQCPSAFHLEAIGAAVLAGEHALSQPTENLPGDPAALIRSRERRFAVLEPSHKWSHRVTRLPATSRPPGSDRRPAVLGLDLGSTGAKAVLVDVRTGEVLRSVYDRTRGNPFAAARRLVEMLVESQCPDLRAIGLTGSGREAVAAVVRAAYPEAAQRMVVENEIVAHATAAVRTDPHNGRSLSVVEIGGQDAKFIQIRDGQIVESDLNRACSAGTGSFLEEQAVLYGVSDIAEFGRLAMRAARPPDLGQMCTVFVADAAAEALKEGFEIADVFAGFQYSVIHNYINRVMGQRSFGERIMFQGKPASSPSLAWTLAAVTGREVVVPPDPGAMGAWGIGLCALRACGAERLVQSPPLDPHPLLAAQVRSVTEFQCRDQRCDTLCIIQRTRVDVGGRLQTVLSGGACPKYEAPGATQTKLPREAPNAYGQRGALLTPYFRSASADRIVGIPGASACHGYLPWLWTFVRELGLAAQCLAADQDWLTRGEQGCSCYDACTPVKLMHGMPDVRVDKIFFPKFFTYADPDGSEGRTCPMEQALPEMFREMLAARGDPVPVVHPKLSFARGLDHRSLHSVLRQSALEMGAEPKRVAAAIQKAATAQRAYWRQLAAIGDQSLGYARRHGIATILVCGPLHVIHEDVVNAGIPRLLREQGVLVLPMDCYPIPPHTPRMPRVVWSESNRVLRTALAARHRGDVYPVLLTSFGCGPGSFLEQLFCHVMQDYPHTVLESDGHSGSAGYLTRIQALLHTVRHHDGRPSPVSSERLALLARVADRPLAAERDRQLVVFSLGDRLSSHIAAAYRSAGFDAVPSDPVDAATLASGRQDCSGKECLPYQVLWSGFKPKLVGNGKGKTMLQVPGQGMCRNCLFSLKDELAIQRMGLADRVQVRHFGPELVLGRHFGARVWAGVVCWDLLFQLAAYCRPLARFGTQVDRLYETFNDELNGLLQQPLGGGLRAIVALARSRMCLCDLVDRAAVAFAEVMSQSARNRPLRRVLLSGDVYLRLDQFASDHLIRRLNDRGMPVIVEPLSLLTEYMAEERLGELMGLPVGWTENLILKQVLHAIRSRLYSRVRAVHSWLPPHNLRGVMLASRGVLDQYPLGEAPVTIGSVLYHWRERLCDGVVVVSPWGCGPALVSESLLRHRDEIPILFVYADGTPLDEQRIDAFAFHLQRTPPRTAQTGLVRRE